MNNEQLHNIVQNAHKFGKDTLLKEKDGLYQLFSTPDKDGNIRCSEWWKTEKEVLEHRGHCNGYPKEDFLQCAKEGNYQFVRYIDIHETYNIFGYTEGMKVAIHPDAEKMCKKKGLGWGEEMTQMLKDGYGYFCELCGNNLGIWNKDKNNFWYFPSEAISPFIEEEPTTAVIDGKTYEIKIIREL